MNYVSKSASSPAVRGENLGRLTELTPVQRPEGFFLAAKFSVVSGRAREQSAIVYVQPKDFVRFAKCLTSKGTVKKGAFVDGQKLIGCMAQLDTSADSTTVKRLKPVETPEQITKGELLAATRGQ
jgi:hypothetical protein